MAGYNKNIAVIRALKGGFSADGGALSGLVKAEKYGGYLRAEVVKINFAPLSSGRYVTGVSDGVRVALCEGDAFEGNTDMDISFGFAALVCFVREGEVTPVATAVCGDYSWALARIQSEIELREGASDAVAYDDDAIAEDNYYEYDGDGAQDGGSLRADTQQKAGAGVRENEDDFGICRGQTVGKAPIALPRADGEENCNKQVSVSPVAEAEGEGSPCENNLVGNSALAENNFGNSSVFAQNSGEEFSADEYFGQNFVEYSIPFEMQHAFYGGVEIAENKAAEEEAAFHRLKNAHSSDKNNGLGEGSGQNFYLRVHAEIERLLADYPREEKLEHTVKGSRWVRINYGGGRYYVFGVIYEEQLPAYVCYGVPSKNSSRPPVSLAGMASYIPAGRQGYWVMYQNARTGESVKMRAN